MGLRGPKALPNELKILAGTRKDRIGGLVAQPGGSPLPECPAWLDDVARAEWERVVPIFAGMRVLTEADGPMLAQYCDAFSLLQMAREDIGAHRTACKSAAGTPKGSPAVAAAVAARAQMIKILAEFGGSPSSRGRLAVSPDEKQSDPFAEFLKRKG